MSPIGPASNLLLRHGLFVSVSSFTIVKHFIVCFKFYLYVTILVQLTILGDVRQNEMK